MREGFEYRAAWVKSAVHLGSSVELWRSFMQAIDFFQRSRLLDKQDTFFTKTLNGEGIQSLSHVVIIWLSKDEFIWHL